MKPSGVKTKPEPLPRVSRAPRCGRAPGLRQHFGHFDENDRRADPLGRLNHGLRVSIEQGSVVVGVGRCELA